MQDSAVSRLGLGLPAQLIDVGHTHGHMTLYLLIGVVSVHGPLKGQLMPDQR